MAVGNQIGTFNLTSTSITLHAKGSNVSTAEVNFEGTVSGEMASTVLATMTVESNDGVNGDYRICARCFAPDGTVFDAVGDGKTTSAGGQKWTVAGVTTLSDGRSTAVQGEIDLAARSFSGKMFERH